MVVLPWIILFAPMLACMSIVLFARKSRSASARLAIGAMALSFLGSCAALLRLGEHVLETSLPWIVLPELFIEFGLLLDAPAILMSLVVTGVGLMIFIYSIGYMAKDQGVPRYFAMLALFAFSMLGIVLANNFITLFIFWELVGASSYLLIGHWYERPQAAEAGKKAFLVNRLADFGFLMGILMLWNLSGADGTVRTLNFYLLAERLGSLLASGTITTGMLAAAGGLIFCGVVGKSAQFPLHVWLPDAMEGPTPVSALIHAATMVAAGVYLLIRVFFLVSSAPELMSWIAVIGGFTALFAASMALVENDIKRILAYSTLSQLGYMVMAIGLGGAIAGAYHLTTHAFFKALLFLGAGSVIHALHTNDIRQMGGLFKRMPWTSITFGIAALALAGIFPLAGFWSKDEILALALTQNPLLGIVGTFTAGLTSFYVGRLAWFVFLGRPRTAAAEHAHESPRVMTIPMVVLAIFSTAAGFLGIPAFLHRAHLGSAHTAFSLPVALLSTGVAVAGLVLAYAIYQRGFSLQPALRDRFLGLGTILKRKYYMDELYAWINRNIQQRLAILLGLFERIVIIGLWVNGIARLTQLTGSALRRAQTGQVQGYALVLLAGLTFILYVALQ